MLCAGRWQPGQARSSRGATVTDVIDRDEILARLDKIEEAMRALCDTALHRIAETRAALQQPPHPDPEQDRKRRRLILLAIQCAAPGWWEGVQN